MTRADTLATPAAARIDQAAAQELIDAVEAAQTDLVDIVATLKPRVVIMGGQADDGD